QIQVALLVLARNEFLEQKSICRQRIDRLAFEQGWHFVAERKEATRLEAHDRYAARNIRRQRIQCTLHFTARLIHEADREKGATTTQWPLVGIRRKRRIDAIAACHQHIERRIEIFPLEI